jgi:hypothetical protein
LLVGLLLLAGCGQPEEEKEQTSTDDFRGEDRREDNRKAGPTAEQMRDVEKAVKQQWNVMWNVTKQDGLQRAWSIRGGWHGVASDRNSGLIYVLGPKGKCAELNASGNVLREFELPENEGLTLRLAQLPDDKTPQLLTFSKWVPHLQAYDLSGSLRWSYRSGINDVYPFDLNGDGADEVVIGFNGSVGLHVLDSEGALLWQADGANLHSVSAGDVLGAGVPQVLTTCHGRVHIFGQDGKKIKMLDPGLHAFLVCATSYREDDRPGAVLVGWGRTLASLSGEGVKNWSIELPFHEPTAIKGMSEALRLRLDAHVNSAQVAIKHPWLAIASDWGDVCVVDTSTGNVIGHVNGQGRPRVCWAEGETNGDSLLVTATGRAVNAFRVTK